ncbi:DUF1127 domain-containing protein [Neptunomonas japonica]|uniref:DUF1127 domain-containing protein n=1 Tax=Neptunomonas japonica TaxID=417574 RepID=UPI0004132EB6|nr:DUF1127 domain-containing protein [Neptunomonas japonica]
MNTNDLCLRKAVSNEAQNATFAALLQQNIQRWKECLQHWHMNWRTRQQLSQLSSYQLKDIGFSAGEAQQEVDKPFWKD